MSFVEVKQGDSPVILGLPHTGTDLPDDVARSFNETGRKLADTDWHVHTLYEGLLPNLTSVRTKIHRYVIDVNRDPSGVSLYPGQNTTTLCPLTDFDGQPIYKEGLEPESDTVESRRLQYHAPYHSALEQEIARIKAANGFAILYDCHSIRSNIPFLFEGKLPDFNIGTNNGATCASSIQNIVETVCVEASGYTTILNGRFKGGWTTRHYGDPENGIHAVQMELAQSTYLDAELPPWRYSDANANQLRRTLADILKALNNWRPS